MDSFDFKRGQGSVLLIACGALAKEVVALIEVNGWRHLDVACLPAHLHHRPQLIPEAVREKIRSSRPRYETIYVLYGDCGTGGLLDDVLREEGVERIGGPHCFSFYQGNDVFADNSDEDIQTFYLTDFFCQHFDKFVWQAIGLDRHPKMPSFVFGNYRKVLYVAQTQDAALQCKARQIAERLGLDYEYRFVGYGDLESFMREDAATTARAPRSIPEQQDAPARSKP